MIIYVPKYVKIDKMVLFSIEIDSTVKTGSLFYFESGCLILVLLKSPMQVTWHLSVTTVTILVELSF